MKRILRLVSPPVLRWVVLGAFFTAFGVCLIKVLAGVLQWPYVVATLVSGEIGTILRFLAVDWWVFQHARPTRKRLWQYHAANVVGFTIWWGAANLLKAVGVQYLVASVLATFVSVGFSLASNFLWVWRKPAPQPDC